MKRILIRRLVRALSEGPIVHPHALGYLNANPWLKVKGLVPLGTSVGQGGIKFEEFTAEHVFGDGEGRVYLVDKFGQALSGASFPWMSPLNRLYCQIYAAIRRLPVNEAYVAYIVKVTRLWNTATIRIHRVKTGINLSEWLERTHRKGIDNFGTRLELARKKAIAEREAQVLAGQTEAQKA